MDAVQIKTEVKDMCCGTSFLTDYDAQLHRQTNHVGQFKCPALSTPRVTGEKLFEAVSERRASPAESGLIRRYEASCLEEAKNCGVKRRREESRSDFGTTDTRGDYDIASKRNKQEDERGERSLPIKTEKAVMDVSSLKYSDIASKSSYGTAEVEPSVDLSRKHIKEKDDRSEKSLQNLRKKPIVTVPSLKYLEISNYVTAIDLSLLSIEAQRLSTLTRKLVESLPNMMNPKSQKSRSNRASGGSSLIPARRIRGQRVVDEMCKSSERIIAMLGGDRFNRS